MRNQNTELDNVTIYNARIFGRNFVGQEGKYNRAGDRNFCVIIDPEIAEKMIDDGWNVKTLAPRDDGDEPEYYLPVAVSYKKRPPKVYIRTSRKQTLLTEDTVEAVDYADIKNVDLTIHPYQWVINEGSKNEKRGIKAYLKTMYVTVEEDELDSKYAEFENPGEEPWD